MKRLLFLNCTCSGFGKSSEGTPFIVLERISLTLQKQCKLWKTMHANVKMNRNKRIQLWNKRLEVMKDLVNVMSYLHESE